jgi:hypothetical protein
METQQGERWASIQGLQSCQSYALAAFHPQGNSVVLICVRGRADRRKNNVYHLMVEQIIFS